MNDQEIESGGMREIEPEVRTLLTKLVEHDPQEAAKMPEPYPDEFVVHMLELLNPAKGDVAWNIKRSLDRRNRRNRDVCLCNNGEKPAGFDVKFCGVPGYHH